MARSVFFLQVLVQKRTLHGFLMGKKSSLGETNISSLFLMKRPRKQYCYIISNTTRSPALNGAIHLNLHSNL